MTTFVISDMHIPYQDQKALNIVYKIQALLKPKTVIINGDLLDFPQISRFSTDPLDKENFTDSLDVAIKVIKRLQKYSDIIFIYGNHDIRLRNYIWREAPYLAQKIGLRNFMKAELDKPITFIEGGDREAMLWYDDSVLIGHFNKVNMHSAYTAKNLCDKYQCSLVQAHTHRQGVYYKRIYRKTIIGVEQGCLCNMNPVYVAHPDWQQGFIILDNIKGMLNFELVHIDGGKCIFRGKAIKG